MAVKQRKIPLRTCIGCLQPKDKRELLRIVRSPEGRIFADATGKAAGRGAYVCKDTECLKAARTKRRLEKSFSCRIEASVYEEIENEIKVLGTADNVPQSRED